MFKVFFLSLFPYITYASVECIGPSNASKYIVYLHGSSDSANQKPVRDYVSHLQILKAPVILLEYNGKHEIIYEPLEEQLKKL